MAGGPTTLILFHHYGRPRPAIDGSPFLRHAACRNTEHLPDGAEAGSGALAFRRADSAVKVATAPHWERLRGLVIDAMVRFDGSVSMRRNIVEGDGCFAFFVSASGEVRFDLVSLVAGQSAAAWNGVSSITHALGPAYRIVPERWIHLQASFDGAVTARIRVDGRLVAERRDYRSSLGTPGRYGVAIGNWTLRNQYALHGEIDWIAIRKLDDRASVRDFLERMDRKTQRAWGDFVNCLRAQLGDKLLAAFAHDVGDLLARIACVVAATDEAMRGRIFARFARYASLWKSGQLSDPAYSQVLDELRDLLSDVDDGRLVADMLRLQEWFEQQLGQRAGSCFRRSGLETQDREWISAFGGMDGAGSEVMPEARP